MYISCLVTIVQALLSLESDDHVQQLTHGPKILLFIFILYDSNLRHAALQKTAQSLC